MDLQLWRSRLYKMLDFNSYKQAFYFQTAHSQRLISTYIFQPLAVEITANG
jgi:hypothetical protein